MSLQSNQKCERKPEPIVIKEVVLEEIGKIAKITIYKDTLEAIEKKWESLYFSANNRTFAEVLLGDYAFFLETNGEVKIYDQNAMTVLNNGNENEIAEILKRNQLDDENNYALESNNWFALAIGVMENGNLEDCGIFDDEVFAECPETVEQLEQVLIQKVLRMYQTFNK